jgi:glutaredoxin
MKEKVNVYLFWGNGCPHCEIAKFFLKKLSKEYGEYFNLVEKEVWDHPENEELLNKIANHFGKPADTVPYIVIGNDVFGVVHKKSIQDEIVASIKKHYDDSNYEDEVALLSK